MIRRLRAEHRVTFVILALVLPLGLGLALNSRLSMPASAQTPPGESAPEEPRNAPLRDEHVLPGAMTMRLRLWAADAKGARVLELTPEHDLELPDVLVYWADSEEVAKLPSPCVLLGSLAGTQARRFTVPSEAHGGRLYLYSLAHQQVVASREFER